MPRLACSDDIHVLLPWEKEAFHKSKIGTCTNRLTYIYSWYNAL